MMMRWIVVTSDRICITIIVNTKQCNGLFQMIILSKWHTMLITKKHNTPDFKDNHPLTIIKPETSSHTIPTNHGYC